MEIGALIDAVKGIKDIGSLFKGNGGKSSKGGGKSRGDGKTCFQCGKTGHLGKDCWFKPKGKGKDNSLKGKSKGQWSRSPSQSSRLQGKCNLCGKEGHKAADCWSKEKGKGKGGSKGDSKGVGALVVEPEREAEAGGLDLCHLSSDLSNGWLRLNYDTGAAVTALPKVYKTEAGESTNDTHSRPHQVRD